MKTILVLGAGHSSPFLIRRLLEEADERDWLIRVADLDPAQAAGRIDGHPRGAALVLDAADRARRAELIGEADIVINLLPQSFQPRVAEDCVRLGRHMICASYTDERTRALAGDAQRREVLLLLELGLDPGIDHMSSMALIDRLHGEGAVVESFESYGSGVPPPGTSGNPLGYAVTWNPRNVVMAGESGALYLWQRQRHAVPAARVFETVWPVDVPGVGRMEAYPNRNSLIYHMQLGLADADTLVRGTLRHPGWCAFWHQIVRLGLPTETVTIPDLDQCSFAELLEMFLPRDGSAEDLEQRVARYLELDSGGEVMQKLRWLGLFSSEPIGGQVTTPAAALTRLIGRRLALPPGGRDMIILMHRIDARYPGQRDASGASRRERITSTLVEYGEPGGITAMARTVGLPQVLAARLLLADELILHGCHIPTEPAIYRPMLAALEQAGLAFSETHTILDGAPGAARTPQ